MVGLAVEYSSLLNTDNKIAPAEDLEQESKALKVNSHRQTISHSRHHKLLNNLWLQGASELGSRHLHQHRLAWCQVVHSSI